MQLKQALGCPQLALSGLGGILKAQELPLRPGRPCSSRGGSERLGSSWNPVLAVFTDE